MSPCRPTAHPPPARAALAVGALITLAISACATPPATGSGVYSAAPVPAAIEAACPSSLLMPPMGDAYWRQLYEQCRSARLQVRRAGGL